MEGQKESVLPSVGEEPIGGIHIKKRQQKGVVERNVDPYTIRVGIERKKERRWKVQKRIGSA